VVRRSTVEEHMGRPFDLQELHINLITLTGHIDETDDEFTLSWAH
jgi:phenol hydroxylase P2 protein